ncbi:MAG TPA: hypothetical protein DCX14_09480, partial [Flavobacteriales bacterium]|nr:hypothetical protein [Flavobacteriales bacterium]
MDRNTITGLLLIGVILIGYSLWMQPSAEEQAETQRIQDSISVVEANVAAQQAEDTAVMPEDNEPQAAVPQMDSVEMALRDSLEKITKQKRFGSFAEATVGETILHTIENDFVRLTLSNKGGAPVMAELKNYVTFDSMPLYLFDKETSEMNYSFWVNKSQEIDSRELFFEPVTEEMSDTRAVYRMYGNSNDEYVELRYEVQPGESYLVDAEVAVVGMDNVLDASEGQFELDWAIQAPFHERSRKQEQQKTTVFYKHFDGKADYISESNYEVEKFEAAVQWVAFKQQFFSAVLISETGFSMDNAQAETIELEDPRYTKGI